MDYKKFVCQPVQGTLGTYKSKDACPNCGQPSVEIVLVGRKTNTGFLNSKKAKDIDGYEYTCGACHFFWKVYGGFRRPGYVVQSNGDAAERTNNSLEILTGLKDYYAGKKTFWESKNRMRVPFPGKTYKMGSRESLDEVYREAAATILAKSQRFALKDAAIDRFWELYSNMEEIYYSTGDKEDTNNYTFALGCSHIYDWMESGLKEVIILAKG